VHIVTRRHLNEVSNDFPDAAREIAAWMSIVRTVRWHNFSEVVELFADADFVNGYVVFNIRRNRYRLITVIHFAKPNTDGHVYVRSFLTHKQYENPANWDRRFGAK
jgi:mRNA interferase HigB